jgi:hypothetical protein
LLVEGLSTPGYLISVSGLSKSGKTVLVERVVGDFLITISGAGIRSSIELWNRVMAWLGEPIQTSTSTTTGTTSKTAASAEASGGLLSVIAGKGGLSLASDRSTLNTNASQIPNDLVESIRKEFANSGFVLFIDDFHYIDRSVQSDIAKQLKYLASVGVKLVAASVPFRGDDVVRSNNELQGRLLRIDIPSWTPQEIQEIAISGFPQLQLVVESRFVERLQLESCESPQLMQSLCLALARRLQNRSHEVADESDVDEALKFTALTVDYRNLTKALDQGAKTRGTERKIYELHDGTTGDVYRVILKALASSPPRANFSYQQLVDRVNSVCKNESPSGSSIAGTCSQLKKLAESVMQGNNIDVDWDEDLQIFDIPNPFFLYYLRWAGLLLEPQYR